MANKGNLTTARDAKIRVPIPPTGTLRRQETCRALLESAAVSPGPILNRVFRLSRGPVPLPGPEFMQIAMIAFGRQIK